MLKIRRFIVEKKAPALRAVWVPEQDLASPHLMRNCRKLILSLHCMLYVRLCVRKYAYGIHGVSGSRDMNTRDSK